MKSLAYIGTFTLGALAGGYLMFSALCYGLEHRMNNLVDKDAVIYEDEDIRIIRCTSVKPNESVGIATIVYKNHF